MRYRLRTLLIALAILPPLLAGVVWLARFSGDFWIAFGCVVGGLAIGVPIATAIAWLRPHWAKQFQVKSVGLPWWTFAASAGMFALAAWLSGNAKQFTWSVTLCGIAGLQIAAMILVIWRETRGDAWAGEGRFVER